MILTFHETNFSQQTPCRPVCIKNSCPFVVARCLVASRLCVKSLILMKTKLNGKKVAILVTDGFEQIELTSPKAALEKAGAETQIVSPAGAKVRGWEHTKWGKTFRVDVPLKKAKADDYDALLLPGGV